MKNYAWIIIPLMLAFSSCIQTEMTPENAPQAPEFTLEDLQGNEITLSSLTGKVVFMNVWATWCDPCKDEIPHFIEAYDQHKEKGLEIIGVSIDELGKSKVLQFAQEWKINYPVVMTTKQLTKDYGPFNAVPVTVIIDKNGKIRHRKIGYMDKDYLENWFFKLVEEE
jgi:peroxiredoxin